MKALTRSALAVALVFVPVATHAHFKLLAPTSWLIENDLGDPQKAAPCGGTNTDFGKPTYAVTQATGGSALHIRVQETIYHPGHYRVALAVNSPTELPPDPKATTMDSDRGPRSVSAEIQNPVQTAGSRRRPVRSPGEADAPFETDVTLAQHQLPPVHASSDPVHGTARGEQPGHVHLSPLRDAADHRRSEEADRRCVAEGAIASEPLHLQPRPRPFSTTRPTCR